MSIPTSKTAPSIVFYGAGSMAEAIVRGMIKSRLARPEEIAMINRSNQERLHYLEDRYGVTTAASDEDKRQLLAGASTLVLAMKPKDAGEALRMLSPLLSQDVLVISVIAGLSISTLHKLIGRSVPIARTMPNTSSTIGFGATGISFSPEVDESHRQQTLAIFEACGTVSVIPEEQMEILTGVSGSGPAYIYYMMEAMIEAGIEGGLTPEQARELTVQTVLGAATMMKETGEEPTELRRAITSPNGSTQAAIEVLSNARIQSAVKAAVHRAAERSLEMGEEVRKSL